MSRFQARLTACHYYVVLDLFRPEKSISHGGEWQTNRASVVARVQWDRLHRVPVERLGQSIYLITPCPRHFAPSHSPQRVHVNNGAD